LSGGRIAEEKLVFCQSKEGKIMPKRRYDIDWLRVLVMLAVFFFHSALFFRDAPWICLILGLVSFVGIFSFSFELGYWGGKPFSLIFVLYQTVYGIGRWSWIVFVLSLGAKYLSFNNNVLAYSSEAVLPFYILHHTIIVCVGWFVIRWNIGILPKFLIIVLASFALILVLYELLVKPFNVGRFLFGMRPKKKPSARPAPHPEGTAA
jgi:hypothetical protein